MDRGLNGEVAARARQSLAGGVNSPARSFRSVGGTPVIARSAEGAWLTDAEGRRYADFLMAWGAIILGHAHPAVTEAVRRAAGEGNAYGLTTAAEARLAELVKSAFPSIDLLRMTTSGTEAAMTALRLARAFTGRRRAVVFDGAYHGHSDALLGAPGSGLVASAGLATEGAGELAVARFNDAGSVRDLCARAGGAACVLIEPVLGNIGVVPPAAGFLAELREICDRTGALLIFDEVITGFRVARGGAQELYGVRADLAVFGKIIGGGLPAGAVGGRREIMERLAPAGEVYHAGTMAGNPVVVAAGTATLEALFATRPWAALEALGARMESGLRAAAEAARVPAQVNRVGSMFTLFFADRPVTNALSARRADKERFARFFGRLLQDGVLLAPSPWEACFFSAAHGEGEIDRLLDAAARALERERA
jgi:glutamate-1-semialdehyde 2,1-aminomutase